MNLMDAAGLTLIINFFWPLLVGVIVLVLIFRMAASLAEDDIDCDEAEKAKVTFVRRAFWTGIIIVVLCVVVWYLPEIKDHFEAFGEAMANAAGKAKDAIK